jgi:predicted transposase/invertase (TIGR01784 family)
MRFADITNDIAFRKIFGNENKTNILISFLNAILKFEGKERIIEAEIANPYQFPRIAGEKASIIDVRAKDGQGRQYVVEMQVAAKKGFSQRVQYYAARDYSMQIDSGEKYYLLKPTFLIGILDFDHFKTEKYLSNHSTLDEETYENELDDIKYTFIELPKFTLKSHQIKTLIEKWVFFIKEAENLDVIPENTDDEGLIEAYKDADKYTWTKEELKAYDNAFIAEQDEKGKLQYAEETGEKRGIQLGVQEKTMAVVKKCLKKGMAVEDIVDIAELSTNEVKEIIKEL